MEDGDNKIMSELSDDKKSFAGIPEADFVVIIYLFIYNTSIKISANPTQLSKHDHSRLSL